MENKRNVVEWGRKKERTKYREKQNVRIQKISKQMGKIESVQGSQKRKKIAK